MKSQKPVGLCFPDVCEAFLGTISYRIADSQLGFVLPTFGEHFLAPKRVKNLGRQAPLHRGSQRWIRLAPLGRCQNKQVCGPPSRPKNDGNIRKSASKTRPPDFFVIRMRDGIPHPAVLAPGPVRQYHMYNPPLFSVSNIQYIHTSRGGGLEGVGYFLLGIP